jgi:uncharacterized protein YjdB
MKTAALLLCVIIVAACEGGDPLPVCQVTVQLNDAPINLQIGASTTVIANVSPLGACGNRSKRVEWSASVPRLQLTAVNDTTIQITGLSAGTTMLRARSLLVLSSQDSVQVTTAP